MNTSPIASPHTARWPSRVTRSGLWIIAAGVLLAAVSGPLYRLGIANLRVALLFLLSAGFLVTAIGAATTIIGLLAGIAKRSPVPRAMAAVGIVVGLVLIGYMLHWMARARATPPIHDVSTDLADPQAFVAVLPLRAAAHASNSAQYIRQVRGGGRVIDVPALQRQYFPDLRPLELPLSPAQALAKARRVASELHWQLDAYDPVAGRLEATAQTAFFGFKDDVVVRVRPNGSGSRIDIRSDSRVGFGDVGTNAARIRVFLKRMAEH